MTSRKLRIAWFSHLSRPQEVATTTSQYCTELLVPHLRDEFSIEIFSGLYTGEHCGVPRHHYLTAFQRHREQPFDLFFYQLEDGPLGRFQRTQIGIMPGVTWVHDLFLSDLGAEGIHTSPWERSLAQFFDSSASFADRMDPPHQLRPQAYRETSLSPMTLFSSKWGKREFSRWVTARLEYVPGAHRAEYLPIPVLVAGDGRRRNGGERLEVLAVGTTRMEGRAHKFLPALAALRTPWHLTWIIEPSERSEAEVLLQEFSIEEHVSIVEGNSPERWRAFVAKSDIALHLHSSPFGHLGPYLHLSMAAGLSTVVMRYASAEELPPDVAFSIVPGMHESEQILGVLEAVSRDKEHSLGEAGRAFMEHESEVRIVAGKLAQMFEQGAPAISGVMERWVEVSLRGEEALLGEVRRHIDAPPPGMPGSYDTIVAPFIDELQRSR